MLAKVDATVEQELGSRFGISGYPTLKIFRKGVESGPYEGPRQASGIVKHMQKQAGPSSKGAGGFALCQSQLSLFL